MLIVENESDFNFEHWSVKGLMGDLQEWTSLIVKNSKVIDIIEGIEWADGDSVDIGICPHCGGDDGPDIRVDISRSHGFIWLTPQIVVGYTINDHGVTNDFGKVAETLIISEHIWQKWFASGIVDRAVETCKPTTYRHLKNAWLSEAGQWRWLVSDKFVVSFFEGHNFVSEELLPGKFVSTVRLMLEAFNNAYNEPVAGCVNIVEDKSVAVHSAWFIEDSDPDWHAFGQIGGVIVPSFGNNQYFLHDSAVSVTIP